MTDELCVCVVQGREKENPKWPTFSLYVYNKGGGRGVVAASSHGSKRDAIDRLCICQVNNVIFVFVAHTHCVRAQLPQRQSVRLYGCTKYKCNKVT